MIVGGILVAVVVGIVVASGGSDDEPSRARPPETLATIVPAAPPAAGTTPDEPTVTTSLPARAVGDKVTFPNGTTIQVFSYEQPVPADRFFEPDPGNEFAVIDVEFCASPTTETPYNALGFATQMADDRRFEALSGGVRTPRLNSGDLPAGGDCTRGWVLLQVPVGERPASVVWDYPRYVEASWVVPTG